MGNKQKGKSKRSRSVLIRRQQRRLRHSAPRPLSSAASPARTPDAQSGAVAREYARAQRTEDARVGAPGDAQAEPLTEEAAHMELAEQIAQDTDDSDVEEPETGRGARGQRRHKRATTLALVQESQESQEGQEHDETAPVAAADPQLEGRSEVARPLEERGEQEAGAGTSAPPTQPALPRVVRRTKTLADVAMPGRLAAPRGDAPAAGTDEPAERAAEGEPAGGERSPGTGTTVGRAEAESQRTATGPTAALRARGRLSTATRPIPSVGPLAPQGGRGGGAEEQGPLAEGDETPGGLAASRFLWAVRRGDARLVLRAALAHGLVGLVAGVAASALLLAGSDLGFWLLGLAGVTLLCGIAAYVLPQWKGSARQAALVLAGAQLVALGWACALLGPWVGLMLLVPAAVWLALRLGGRRPALLIGIGSLVVYGGFVIAVASGAFTPALGLSVAGGTFLDAGAALVGVSLLLAGLLRMADARERSEAAARARLYELRLLRGEVARMRAQAEQDSFVLEQALTGALRGRGIEPVTAEGAFSPLAEGVNAAAERMATLQKDREDRLRLEAALRTLVRAVERGWLGLPWTWPDASGTMLDDLVALLRTPRPQEQPPRSARRGGEELPAFVTLPTVETPSRPSGAHSTASTSFGNTPLPGQGWDDLLSH